MGTLRKRALTPQIQREIDEPKRKTPDLRMKSRSGLLENVESVPGYGVRGGIVTDVRFS